MGRLPDLDAVLRRTFGYPGFRPGQKELIEAVLQGRDALGILPTGGGKSVCFQLPASLLPGTVLVVSPLISLMEDQTGRARALGLRADFLSSATPAGERAGLLQRALEGRTDLLLVAPERLRVPRFQRLLSRLPVSLLAVDEAHCISCWGHDFRPDYLRIGEVRREISGPVMALTATATPRVQGEIVDSLRLQSPHRFVGSFDRPNLGWEVRPASTHAEKIRRLAGVLREREGASIIYASTRRSVEAVRAALASYGLPALAYHAALSPPRRTRVQERFLADPAPVVVATNAFGMGIDRPDVRIVLHYQLPGSLEAYYQEAGRAGRDGAPARCMALFGRWDEGVHRRFLAQTHPPRTSLQRILARLRQRVHAGEAGTTSLKCLTSGRGGSVGLEEVRAGLGALERIGAVSLDGDSVCLLDPHPDLATLSTLRQAAWAQLAAVTAYARTGQCRRRLILEYFGERGTGNRCGRCDRCLGRHPLGAVNLLWRLVRPS
jgi:ATP-dependent DNA helicase RecQ